MTAISGPFILGLDDTPLYRHDHQALRAAIRREDSDGLAQRTLSTARDRLRMTDGQVDVVGQFADPTIDAVMSDYSGRPGPVRRPSCAGLVTSSPTSFSMSEAAPIRTNAHGRRGPDATSP